MNRRTLLQNSFLVGASLHGQLRAQKSKPAAGRDLKLPMRAGEILDVLKATGSNPVVLKGEDPQKWVIVCPKLVGRVMCTSDNGAKGLATGFIDVAQLNKGFGNHGKADWNNFGGIERLWFTPEGGKFGFFFLPGEPQDWDHYLIPPAMWQEQYRLAGTEAGGKSAAFFAVVEMTNYQGHKFKLAVRREITILEDCPFAVGLGSRIRCVGFESRNWVKNSGEQRLSRDATPLGIWTLGQYDSGPRTVVMLPYRKGSEAELGPPVTTEYFRYFLLRGSMPASQWATREGCVMVKADGKVQTKLEILRRRALGRLASLNLDDLTMNIVTCETYPELPYPASYNLPYDGDPLDGGVLSTFMNEGVPGNPAKPAVHELEVCSPLLELLPDEQYCHVSRSYQIRGDETAIDQICRTFFNVELKTLRQFAGHSRQ